MDGRTTSPLLTDLKRTGLLRRRNCISSGASLSLRRLVERRNKMSLPLEKILKILWQTDEHRVRSDFTQHSKVQTGRADQKFLTNPEKTRVVFTSLAKKCWLALSEATPCTREVDGQETYSSQAEKNVASGVHMEGFKARKVDIWQRQSRETRKKASLTMVGTLIPTEFFSEHWKGFTVFEMQQKRSPKGTKWVNGRLTKSHQTSRPDYLWPVWWTTMSKNAKKNSNTKKTKKQKKMLHANSEACSTFLRKTKIMKTLFEKLQGNCKDSIPSKAVHHITASHPCTECAGEDPPSKPGGDPTRFEQQKCFEKAESQTPLNSHPDHIATGEDHSVNDHGQVHTPILIPKAVKILRAKAAGRRSGTSSVICRFGAN